MEELSDREILELFAQAASRNRAFNILVMQHQQRLYFHIRKMVLNGLLKEKTLKKGVATKQQAAACNPSYREKVLKN